MLRWVISRLPANYGGRFNAESPEMELAVLINGSRHTYLLRL